ncbi:MAG: N-acetyl sugar amidotransferase [Candidatus Hydrogenedentota bacterium]|nr:MAG: N-acetyl sugar amidotransferase [Candidatus Hydrogenedentota bacterium]
MKYCRKCLVPDTKPYVEFDEKGVCSACRAHEKKNAALHGIDWKAREEEFKSVVKEARAVKAPYYDVAVPVSGGKDSISQVHRLLGYDLRILAVNVDYGIKTEIGWHNLMLIPEMGANLTIYRPDRKLQRKLIRLGLEEYGDPDLMSHTLLHAYPLHVALKFHIPLVLLGENSAFEYGGSSSLAQQNTISREWFERYAANAGRTAKWVSETHGIPYEQLVPYEYPEEMDKQQSTKAVFTSYYFHWDSERHLEIAKRYGFRELQSPREGTYRTYVGIDEKINRLHQYLKVLKFGYGRATDHACEDIRNGRLTREEGARLVKQYDLEDISDDYIQSYLEFLGYTREEFFAILERMRNREIWKQDKEGKWFIPGHLNGILPQEKE